MKYWLRLASLALVMAYPPLIASAQERITEEYVVQILNGEQKDFTSQRSPGLAFSMVSSPRTTPIGNQSKNVSVAKGPYDEEAYKKLLPVGRVLESDALRGFRFAIVVEGEPGGPANEDGGLSMQVAEEIKLFLTTQFAIDHQRLTVKGMGNASPPNRELAEASGPWRWRVKITRID